MSSKGPLKINGFENSARVDSRILEERIQRAVADGYRQIEVTAHGQHGIGGRLWRAGNDQVRVNVLGSSGQRLGSMGFPNTVIEVFGPASDDVGWLNAGATIIVHGDATNGVANAMAQGRIYIDGDIGARGMTMTKHNPRFEPPELWVFGKVGDSFAEFMAGGIAVVCGVGAEKDSAVLSYRPCVGMVGGKIFFRGRQESFSSQDARLISHLPDEEWNWLKKNLQHFLTAIGKHYLWDQLTGSRDEWKLLTSRKPHEKKGKSQRDIAAYRRDVWEKELGPGGLIGDLSSLDRSPIGLITTGHLRRFVPVWENGKFLPPCQANCPTGIPVQKRWELIRQGKMAEAVNLALEYTPFPATVCGYLCPNLCMQHCTRGHVSLPLLDLALLGKASLTAQEPQTLPATGKKIAVIGGGAAGLSVAWQLRLKGHAPVIFESRKKLGGKITETIPKSRIPSEVLEHELARMAKNIKHYHLDKNLTKEKFQEILDEYDYIVIAVGAGKARKPAIPGMEKAVTATDFLKMSKRDKAKVGNKVVIIGAGNVGCDAAAEAARLGAREITLIDVQQPASFGVERKHAEAAGAKFIWPRFTKAIGDEGVELTDGERIPADTFIIAVGDIPDLSFVPSGIAIEKGFIAVDKSFRTTDPRVFAVGDAVKPGLLTEAIGAGRIAARTIDDLLSGRAETYDQLPVIDPARVKLEYFDPRLNKFADTASCADNCASCGSCRDCGICESICPQNAISRRDLGGGLFEYTADAERCIGCGFCAGACPTGVWSITENSPLE